MRHGGSTLTSIEQEKLPVLIKVRGEQYYDNVDPDATELTTEGTMELTETGLILSYEETELTGMAGVTTTFIVEPDKITLKRTGKLNSQMVFQEGVSHDSLYEMEIGALMNSDCANRVMADICHDGGMIDLIYTIELEQSASGTIDYHLDIRPKV